MGAKHAAVKVEATKRWLRCGTLCAWEKSIGMPTLCITRAGRSF